MIKIWELRKLSLVDNSKKKWTNSWSYSNLNHKPMIFNTDSFGQHLNCNWGKRKRKRFIKMMLLKRHLRIICRHILANEKIRLPSIAASVTTGFSKVDRQCRGPIPNKTFTDWPEMIIWKRPQPTSTQAPSPPISLLFPSQELSSNPRSSSSPRWKCWATATRAFPSNRTLSASIPTRTYFLARHLPSFKMISSLLGTAQRKCVIFPRGRYLS